jgi:hypothetical protein
MKHHALPESSAFSSAFFRALGKDGFAECRTRQSPALGIDRVYREQDSWQRKTLGKDNFAERQALGERWRSAKDRQQPSIADGRYPYQVSSPDTR